MAVHVIAMEPGLCSDGTWLPYPTVATLNTPKHSISIHAGRPPTKQKFVTYETMMKYAELKMSVNVHVLTL